MTTNWLIPTLAFVITTGGLGVVSKLALRTLVWQDLIAWMGVGYLAVVTILLVFGETKLQVVAGTGWAILSASLVIGALILFYLALGTGEASKVVPVSAAYPAVTLVLSAVFLSESLSLARVAGVMLVVGGVVLLTWTHESGTDGRGRHIPLVPGGLEPAKPATMQSDDAKRGPSAQQQGTPDAMMGWLAPTLAYVLAVGALGVTSKVALRTLVWQDLVLWVGIGYVTVASALVARGQTRLRVVQGTVWAICAAALAIAGVISLYLALATGQASKVVPVSSAYPAITVILSAIVLSERLSASRVGGMCLVVAGVVVLATVH